MNHLPYIVAAYALTFVVTASFAIQAWLRTAQATRRLAELDPRVSVRPGVAK
jgi:heme exporter protein CcmD